MYFWTTLFIEYLANLSTYLFTTKYFQLMGWSGNGTLWKYFFSFSIFRCIVDKYRRLAWMKIENTSETIIYKCFIYILYLNTRKNVYNFNSEVAENTHFRSIWSSEYGCLFFVKYCFFSYIFFHAQSTLKFFIYCRQVCLCLRFFTHLANFLN